MGKNKNMFLKQNFGAECSDVTENEDTHVHTLLLQHLKGVGFLVATKNQWKLQENLTPMGTRSVDFCS